MLRLADGMPLLPDNGFVPNGPEAIPPLSAAYLRLAPAVNKMIFEDFIAPGLAIILPKSLVLDHLPSFHLSRLSWTSKVGKAKGRPLVDCSAGLMPLNSESTKLSCDFIWDNIQHPTINSLAQMVLNFWYSSVATDPRLTWCDFTLWKVDLLGAYMLSFEPDAVPFMAAELTESNIVFFLCGTFGWSGTPASFQVVSRAIKYEVNKKISGTSDIYVDDLFGISLKARSNQDVATVSNFCESLFQSRCIADNKTEINPVMDVIGYTINWDRQLVTVSRKDFLKVIYGLSAVDFGSRIPVKTLQKFSSWISRYSKICPILTPLAKNIYSSYKNRRHTSIFISNDARISLLVFRALFTLAVTHEDIFARPLLSFCPRCPEWIIEFDASFGGGVIGACQFSFHSLDFQNDSSFQNTSEFLVAIVGLMLAIRLGCLGASVCFRGDSISALTWLESGRFRSSYAIKCASVLTHLCIVHHIHVNKSQHISADKNFLADALSRFHDHGLPTSALYGIDPSPLIHAVNPKVPIDTDDLYVSFWKSISRLTQQTIDSVQI
jgi:hypothetical protein